MKVNMGEAGDMLFDDLEGLLREINEFSVTINKPEDIPQPLERYLTYVAKSGNTVFPWHHVRPLFRSKILQAMEQFPGELCPVNESFVMERFDLFRAAPFTIQRLTELITQPTRHYKKKEKFLRGLEKTVLVVSTVEPWSVDNEIKNGNESTSDGEMDQTYSESDDSNLNRTFIMDQQQDIILPPVAGGLGIGDHQTEILNGRSISAGIELDQLNTQTRTSIEMQDVEGVTPSEHNVIHSENLLENVTTTMVTIMSEETQSSAAGPNSESHVIPAPLLVVEHIPSEGSILPLEEIKTETEEEDVAKESYSSSSIVCEDVPNMLENDVKIESTQHSETMTVSHTYTVDHEEVSIKSEAVQCQTDVVMSHHAVSGPIDHVTTTMVITASEQMQEVDAVSEQDVAHSENVLDTVTTTMVTIMSEGQSSEPPHNSSCSGNPVPLEQTLAVDNQVSNEEEQPLPLEETLETEQIPTELVKTEESDGVQLSESAETNCEPINTDPADHPPTESS